MNTRRFAPGQPARPVALAAWVSLAVLAALPGRGAAAESPTPAPHGATRTVTAAPTSAELRQRLAAMPRGDATRGQAAYERHFCASCHGAEGVAPSLNWPHLAGQRAAYTYKLLQDYQRGTRHEGERAALMRDAVEGLPDQTLADIAVWLAARPLPREEDTPRPPAGGVDVARLVRDGDRSRLLTACASCHGTRGQGGVRATPAIAGQNPAYFVRTMLDYHGGTRANDPERGMRAFAAKLTRAEIDSLATYYADLPLAGSPGR